MNKMTPTNQVNTLALLNSECDAVHIILHNAFRLLKPVRRKYKLSVNSLIIVNAIYVYHKYKGSVFTVNSIYQVIGYYNRNRLKFYLSSLLSKGIIMQAEQNKGIDYYKLTDLGIKIMDDFNNTYQEVLTAWFDKHNISI